jgi:mRNA interferase MazF
MRDGMMFSKKDIVVINFPYSDLIGSKRRPVLIIGEKEKDFIVCAITSNLEVNGVSLQFEEGKLPLESKIKYWQIQTILKTKADKKIAKINDRCFKETIAKINEVFNT